MTHVTTIDENGVPNTISMDRATAVVAMNHVVKKIVPNLDPPAQTKVQSNKDS